MSSQAQIEGAVSMAADAQRLHRAPEIEAA
jgi:hypothetical protein